MDKADIEELIKNQKQILEVIIEDEELRELHAKNARLNYYSYVKAGFTPDEAVKLVSASFKATK